MLLVGSLPSCKNLFKVQENCANSYINLKMQLGPFCQNPYKFYFCLRPRPIIAQIFSIWMVSARRVLESKIFEIFWIRLSSRKNNWIGCFLLWSEQPNPKYFKYFRFEHPPRGSHPNRDYFRNLKVCRPCDMVQVAPSIQSYEFTWISLLSKRTL